MSQQPKLLDQLRNALRLKHYAYRTEQSYVHWVKRYIFFHDTCHPKKMGVDEVELFLTDLAINGQVSASTQNQALSALLFLYEHVLQQPLGHVEFMWAQTPERLPVVLTQDEVQAIMQQLSGTPLLVVQLLYGCGLRVVECLRLRVKDIDFGQQLIFVRNGKGGKDRTTPLPDRVQTPLSVHLEQVKAVHHADLQVGNGRVSMPTALAKKYPNANKEWQWQFVFPSKNLAKDPRGDDTLFRHHLHTSTIQKAIRKAGQQSGIPKRVSPHVFRHSFATHLLEANYDIRTIQQLLGHKDVRTTMIYTHVANRNMLGVRSPLDELPI